MDVQNLPIGGLFGSTFNVLIYHPGHVWVTKYRHHGIHKTIICLYPFLSLRYDFGTSRQQVNQVWFYGLVR
jgi:hypothetical protein